MFLVRDRSLRTAALIVVTLGIISATAPAARAGRDDMRDVTVLLQTMNDERAGRGLRPLQLDRQLCAIAYEHAIDMARRNYCSALSLRLRRRKPGPRRKRALDRA